jgi:nitrite reductase (NADH) large subunit
LLERGETERWNVVTFCEEPRLAYDRVNLTSFLSGKSPGELSLVAPRRYEDAGFTVHLGDRAAVIDRQRMRVLSAEGRGIPLRSAGPGRPARLPSSRRSPGRDAWGLLRLPDHRRCEADPSVGRAEIQTGVVIGGGLLGLECRPMRSPAWGSRRTWFEFAAPADGDCRSTRAARRSSAPRFEALGVSVHTGKNTTRIASRGGRVTEIRFADGGVLSTEMVVFFRRDQRS